MSRHRPAAVLVTLAVGAAAVAPLAAQFPAAVRYELGQRLRRVEQAWFDAAPAARDAGRVAMERAVRSFFAMDAAGAGRQLDAVWVALGTAGAFESAPLARPTRRLATAADGIAVRAPGASEQDLDLVWTVDGEAVEVDVDADSDGDGDGDGPTIRTPGDHRVAVAVRRGDALVGVGAATVSLLADDGARLERFLARSFDRDAEPRLEAGSAIGLQRLLGALWRGGEHETDVPAVALLALGERLAAAVDGGAPLRGAALTGETWLRIPVGQRALPVRLAVPALADDTPRPLLLALHGMGGSEHLFFDGYGDGLLAKLAAERGWIVCAPRAMPAGAARELVEQLAARLPIDRERVYAVGHSMGAATAVAAAAGAPDLFAKVAAIGGGGAVSDPTALRRVGFLVAPGEHDFARAQAEALARRLTEAGVTARLTVVPGVEHMLVVQQALPEVFAWLAD